MRDRDSALARGFVPALLGRVERIPLATLNRVLAGIVLASIAAYVVHLLAFFPNARGRIGHDYEYFLPLLLAGKYWIAENGLLAAPRFSPAFCGGMPFLANPQSIFYSAPQALAFVLGPLASFAVTAIAFAGMGALGTFMLMRRRFATSLPAAVLGAVIFLFNGFLFYRMAVGHVTYHAVGLMPLLCYLLLTPIDRELAPGRRIAAAAGPVAGAAAILAYFVYAGAGNALVPLAIACAIVWLIHAMAREATPSFWLIGAGAAVLGAAAAAAKAVPAMVFVHNFPRLHELMLFDSPLYAIHAVFMGLFLPAFLPPHLDFVDWHEMEFGVGVAPFFLLLAAVDRLGARRLFLGGDLATRARRAALAVLLALPLCLNFGGPGYADFLKSVPYIGDSTILVRWFFIYLMPLTVGAALAIDWVFDSAALRNAAAVAGILLTVLPAVAADRGYYHDERYEPGAILGADAALSRTGAVPAIRAIGPGTEDNRNDGLASGTSSHPCYEPLFGYHLEAFPAKLAAGPILAATPKASHLQNPACFIYGPANGCTPGDTFDAAHAGDEAAFAAYRPYAFALPAWQSWADWISLGGFAAILILGGLALARRRGTTQRRIGAARGSQPN